MPIAPSEMPTVESFCCGKSWTRYYKPLNQKRIDFKFKPTDEQKIRWQNDGFTKLKHLLYYLKKINHGLDKFELGFFNGESDQAYYLTSKGGKNHYLVNIDSYVKYSNDINAVIQELRVTKYSRKISYEYSMKVAQNFIIGEPSSTLVKELRDSHYTLLEGLIKEFDRMTANQRDELKNVLEHSKVGTELIKKYRKLEPGAPEIQLKVFLEVVEKLGEKEVGELLDSILKSKASRYLIKQISKLPQKEQSRIVKKIPEMQLMMERHEKLKKSLSTFRKMVKDHKESDKKDELEIHKFLTKDYWLLGIEYFGQDVHSDVTPTGARTNETKITSRKHADFIIKRMDGTLDTCTIIELEEVNDAIFNKDGTLSREVYDGISQAVDYYIEHRSQKNRSKGMAVIGTTQGLRLTNEQKEKLSLLKETFHNVEILTYDDIINQAENTIRFWETYEENP
jgi:hypothetical protein